MCACEKDNIVYLSGRKNREIDLSSKEIINNFYAVASANPSMSYSGKYIALPNTYKGIEVINRTESNKSVYKYRAYQYNDQMVCHCAWYKYKDYLVFSTQKKIFLLDIESQAKIDMLFCIDDYEADNIIESPTCFSFIKSFDIVNDAIYVLCYRSYASCYIAEIGLTNRKTQIIHIFTQGDCPDSIVSDKQCGYYLVKNFDSVTHYPYAGNIEKNCLLSDSCSTIAVSNNGMHIAMNQFLYKNMISIYDVKTWKLETIIDVEKPVSSISFSDEDHYLLVSSANSILVMF